VEKIFEHYFTTKNWGIGVGLSVSRHILQKHDEMIGYRPGREKGSIFYFTLKRAS
jgi:signal transduction histidine kinase